MTCFSRAKSITHTIVDFIIELYSDFARYVQHLLATHFVTDKNS